MNYAPAGGTRVCTAIPPLDSLRLVGVLLLLEMGYYYGCAGRRPSSGAALQSRDPADREVSIRLLSREG